MKKLMSVLILIAILLSCVGCGEQAAETTAATGVPEMTPEQL